MAVAVLALGIVSAVERAGAICNAIPSARTTFEGVGGALDRPFASPGDFVEVTSATTCRAGTPFTAPLDQHVAIVVFEPHGGDRTLVALASDCGALSKSLGVCNGQQDRNCCREVRTEPRRGVVDMAFATRSDGNGGETITGLRFRFPDTDTELREKADGLMLTGPALIAVTTADRPLPIDLMQPTMGCRNHSELLACVDDLVDATAGCDARTASAPPLDPTFSHFTALPPPNDFAALCSHDDAGGAGPCTASADDLLFTVDQQGNLLIPVDWHGVLLRGDDVPVARIVSGEAHLRAFMDDPSRSPVRLASYLDAVALPELLASYSPEGIRVPPVFDPQLDLVHPDLLKLAGTADAPRGVLRIADVRVCFVGGQRCAVDADCAPDTNGWNRCGLFDLTDRYTDGRGPIRVTREKCTEAAPDDECADAAVSDAAPLEGWQRTTDVSAFVVPEPLAAATDQRLNGDGDTVDDVLVLSDRTTGERFHIGEKPHDQSMPRDPDEPSIGRAVVRTRRGRFTFPALAVERHDGASLVAFLESERGESHDVDGDGDEADAILRAYSVHDGVAQPLTSGLPADAAPLVDGGSLAVSEGRVFFRTAEAAAARHAIELVSIGEDGGPIDADCTSVAISDDGNTVAFVCGDAVYARDRALGVTRRLDVLPSASGTLTSLGCNLQNSDEVTALPTVEGTGAIDAVRMSGDGTIVAWSRLRDHHRDAEEEGLFLSVADLEAGSVRHFGRGGAGGLALSRDGGVLATTENQEHFGSSHWFFRLDLATQTRRCRASSNDVFFSPSLSASGEVAAAVVQAEAHLVPPSGPTLPASLERVLSLALSADGRSLAVGSRVPYVATDNNGAVDVYVRDLTDGSLDQASRAVDGGSTDGRSDLPVLSSDGRYVAFRSDATNLVEVGAPRRTAYYVRDRAAGITDLVADADDGTAGPFAAREVELSGDARFVAFLADDTANLDAGDHDGKTDVFVRAPADEVSVDVTGDGLASETLLGVLAEDGPPTILCPATTTVVAHGIAAFLRPERASAGPGCKQLPAGDLNGDGDTLDDVVHLWTPAGVENLGRAAHALTIGERYVGALVADAGPAPAGSAGRVAAYSLGRAAWIDSGEHGASLAACGDVLAFDAPVSSNGGQPVHVLRLFDPRSGAVVDTGIAVEDFVCSASVIAFRGLDDDLAAYALDRRCVAGGFRSDCLVDSGMPATACALEACDPSRPYRVLDATVRFLVDETRIADDVNGDEDHVDLVLQVLNVRKALAGKTAVTSVATLASAPTGVCTTSGFACTGDGQCPDGGICFVPPGLCRRVGAGCTPSDDGRSTCGDGEFCDEPSPGDSSGMAVCVRLAGSCRLDADCGAGVRCVPTGVAASRLVDPLAGDAGEGVVLQSSGRCLESVGSCGDGSACPAGSECRRGACEHQIGVCVDDGDCPPGARCEQSLSTATEGDRDGDEIPDHLDNCPDLANPDQRDVVGGVGEGMGDGIGDACGPCGLDATCDDANSCTTDSCTDGRCVHAALADGTSCDDGDVCDGIATCRAGTCRPGTPLACAPVAGACMRSCDATAGCGAFPAADGAPCDDGLAVTTYDYCRAGACTGTPCDPPSPCHEAPEIDPATGACVSRPAANGVPCDDHDPCTTADACVAGACVGGAQASCGDGRACTMDACDPGVGCTHTTVTLGELGDGFLAMPASCVGATMPRGLGRAMRVARARLDRASHVGVADRVPALVQQSKRAIGIALRRIARCGAVACAMSDTCRRDLRTVMTQASDVLGCVLDGETAAARRAGTRGRR